MAMGVVRPAAAPRVPGSGTAHRRAALTALYVTAAPIGRMDLIGGAAPDPVFPLAG